MKLSDMNNFRFVPGEIVRPVSLESDRTAIYSRPLQQYEDHMVPGLCVGLMKQNDKAMVIHCTELLFDPATQIVVYDHNLKPQSKWIMILTFDGNLGWVHRQWVTRATSS